MPGRRQSRPWYADSERWMAAYDEYMRAFGALPEDAPHHAELEAFSDLCAMRLVFESNQIENAGLSEGDTRKVIQGFFPKIPGSYESFRNRDIFAEKLDEVAVVVSTHNINATALGLGFGEKSRPVYEVAQHYVAYRQMVAEAAKYKLALASRKLDDILGRESDSGEIPRLITEKFVRYLHRVLAEDLLPEDARVAAGEYRVDARSIGLDVAFPAPELVPGAMENFVEHAHRLLTSDRHPARVAAAISHEFVAIHPFPDFNGRVSRLLLAAALFAAGVPFAVTLRGDKRGKQRYRHALRRADNGNIEPFAGLIARRVVETFQEIDRNLIRAGLKPLRAPEPESSTHE